MDFPPNANLSSGFAPLVVCPNPEHGTTKRHFQVNLDKPLVHCFAACGISGTYERAIAMIKGCNEKEARKFILQHTRISLGERSKRKLRSVSRGSQRRIDNSQGAVSLDYDRFIPAFGAEYLAERGIGPESISRYGIGWDEDERRIVIPAGDERGICRFLIKRAVRSKDWPKYLYWPEGTSKTSLLFGACYLDRKQVSSEGLVLVEGSLDQITLGQYEIQAGAILGTGLSDRQAHIIDKLRPKRIFFMFDPDAAGYRNIKMAAAKLTKYPIFVCLYPRKGVDPNSLSRKEAEKALEKSISLVAFKRRVREVQSGPKRRKEFVNG